MVSAVTLAAGTTGLTLVAPIEGPLRVIPAIVFVLALPGYLATCALFPRARDLSGPERVALSLGLSMAIVPLVGLALNFSPWGIRLAPVVLSIDLLAVTLAFATDLQRRRLGESAFVPNWPDGRAPSKADLATVALVALARGDRVRGRHSSLPAKKRGHAHPRSIDRQVDGREYVVAPSDSLAHLRQSILDRVTRGEITVAKVCRDAGISRARYYQLRRRYLAYGEAGLRPKPHSARPTRQLAPPLVDAIVSYAIFHPTEGERSIAQALRLERFGAWRVGHSGVRAVLHRAGLGRRLARLAAAEALSAAEGGPLTERALREIRAIERPAVMHIGSDVVGAELFADTMYVGKLKGVGTIWQLTMVDGACRFGFARATGGRKSAKCMAAFLEQDVLPVYRGAKLRLVRINTDGGPEFGRAFTQMCLQLGIEHHKLPPRSPDRNAFVERFQGSCLHLHYRTAFRYRYYTSAADIDADLAAFLRHYNFERPHRGYRTKGRRPASIFYAHRPKLLKMKGWDPNELLNTRAV